MAEAAEHDGGRARRRVGPRPASRLAVPAAAKVKSTLHLSVEASQRLGVHCAMTGLDRSAMVEKLINDHLRRYVVSDRGGGRTGSEAGPEAGAA